MALDLTYDLAWSFFYVDGPDLRWRISTAQAIHPGDVAGGINGEGYRCLELKGKHYKAHRIVWLMFAGEWPKKNREVDHIDRNPLNNYIGNLRAVSKSVNMLNSRSIGFRKSGNSWQARIYRKGRRRSKRFKFPEDAKVWYEQEHALALKEAIELCGDENGI